MICIVDDDESVREGLMGLVQSHGYDVEAFASGASFLASGLARGAGCLIVDMHMPGMTGLELHDRLGGYGVCIPTILITARHDESLEARARKAGVFCYLIKPFKEEHLLKCIGSALNERDAAKG